ncbi:MAG: cellulase family glycosylhydrolase [Phycisphaeraceae bacterium]
MALLFLCVLGLAAAAHGQQDLITNGDFAKADAQGVPEGWVWQTRDIGYVKTHTEEGYVEIGVKEAGQTNFIQQIIKLPADTRKVKLIASYRHADIVAGEKSYQKGQVQGRFIKEGKEIGAWISLANVTGSQAKWAQAAQTVTVAPGADAIMVRIALYGVKSGRLEVNAFHGQAISEAQVKEEAARLRPDKPFGEPVSEARYNRMGRGININNWFCQPWNVVIDGRKGGFNAEHFRKYITRRDLDMVRGAGFDHIRLPIDPVFLMDLKTGALKPELLPELDAAVKMILDADLSVVIDLHPKTPPQRGDWHKMPELIENYVVWWGHFSKHLAGTDPERVFIEPMNEPGPQGFWAPAYQPLQDRLFHVIRANLPKHTLIAASGGWTGVDELLTITDVHPDRNVIWTVHYYEPGLFTHQGASWMKSWYHAMQGVPWPLTAENLEEGLAAVKPGMPGSEEAKKVLRGNVARDRCSVQRMRDDIEKIAQWSKEHDRRVIIGECGVYMPYAPRESRLRYLRTLVTILKENSLHWTQWDGIGTGYPIVTNPLDPPARELDKQVVEAMLGS